MKRKDQLYSIKYEVYLDKKEQKIIAINKECTPFKYNDFIFDFSGKKIDFDRKKYFRIIFYSKIWPRYFDYDNENVTMIINKLFEGIPISTLELIYEIEFAK